MVLDFKQINQKSHNLSKYAIFSVHNLSFVSNLIFLSDNLMTKNEYFDHDLDLDYFHDLRGRP